MSILTREQILDAELSPGMARLNRFARRVREGAAIDACDMSFIAEAFEQIVRGTDPRTALAVQGKQGQGRKPMTGHEADKWLQHAIEVERLRRDEGLKLIDARARVADSRHVGQDALEKHHKAMRRTAVQALAVLDAAQRIDD